PSGIRSTREWFTSATRARATAIMSSSQPIALAIAPPILTWIMLSLGWRAMFIVLGAAGLLVAAAWIAFHRARHETPFAEPGTEPGAPCPTQFHRVDHGVTPSHAPPTICHSRRESA